MRVMAAVAAAVDCTSRQIERAACVSEGRSIYTSIVSVATNERTCASESDFTTRPLAIVS